MEPTGRANARPMTGSAQSIRAEKIPEFASLRPGYGFKKIAKAASLASNARRQQEGKHRETRRRALLRQRALCGRGRADDEGAGPLPRMPIYFGRRSQHVCADAARWLQIYKGQPEEIRPQRSGATGDPRILRRVRHAYGDAAAGCFRDRADGWHARRSHAVRRSQDGDLHRRQAAVPYDPGRFASIRAIAATRVVSLT